MKTIKYISLLIILIVIAISCRKDDTKIINDQDSYQSKDGVWQSHFIIAGSQTGTFTAECDVVPEKDSINAIFGLQANVASNYSEVSALIVFNTDCTISARNGEDYVADSSIVYTGATNYHLRFEVDIPKLKYSVYVTPKGEGEVIIAENYAINNFIAFIDQWSTISNSGKQNTLKVSNIKVTERTVNKKPVIYPSETIRSIVGKEETTTIKAVNLSGGKLTMTTIDLPEFATSKDNGNGTITISYNTKLENLGNYTFKVKASSGSNSTEAEFDISVTYNETVIADVADNVVSNNKVEDVSATQLFIGGFGTWPGNSNPDPRDMVAIIPIKLPNFKAGEKVNFARLYVNLDTINNWDTQNYDLYGLPFRTSSAVLATDFWQGEYGTDANAMAIQEKLFTRISTSGEVVSTDNDGGESFAVYVKKQIEDGAKPGDYIFLRINVNLDKALVWGLSKISSANATDDNVKPKVEFFIGK